MMKKTFLLFLAFHFSFFTVKAQNLVPNPSFEVYDTCPNNNDCNIGDAIGWSCYRSCVVYYNSCVPFYNYNGIPYNAAGFQFAASGNAYAGEYFYFPNSGGGGYHGVLNREYLGTTLSSPLIISTKYYVTFKVSLSAIDSALGFNCAINKIGALFSTVKYVCDSVNSTPPNRAQVYTNTIITDTLNWTTIQGSFIADSAYKYIIIGNFFTDAAISKIIFPIGSQDTAAFYYIDDVCVSTDSTYAADWTGTNEIPAEGNDIFVYPNPSNGVFTFQSSLQGPKQSLKIYNVLGEKVYSQPSISNSRFIVNLSNQPSGIYILSINSANQIFYKKIIINTQN